MVRALLFLCCCVQTVAARAAPAGSGAAVAAGSALQVVLGLAAVLALVVAAAWLLKRFSSFGGTGSGMIRVVGGAAVGQRERVVLVEIGNTWLLVGVAPGQVRALHTMQRGEAARNDPGSATDLAPSRDETSFSTWLRRMSSRRDHD